MSASTNTNIFIHFLDKSNNVSDATVWKFSGDEDNKWKALMYILGYKLCIDMENNLERYEIMYSRDDNRKDVIEDINSFKRMCKSLYNLLSCFFGWLKSCLFVTEQNRISHIFGKSSICKHTLY